jgi:hypothetical protein
MSVGANTYGTAAGVQNLIGDIVASRVFTTGTIPALATVEAILDQVAGEINVHLKANGYSVPVALATDPEAHALLLQANNAGAAAVLLSTGPSEAWEQPGLDDVSRGRRHMFENLLTRTLKLIQERRLPATRTSLGFEDLIVGSKLDTDGKTRTPIFTLGRWDYPGTRSLSE